MFTSESNSYIKIIRTVYRMNVSYSPQKSIVQYNMINLVGTARELKM